MDRSDAHRLRTGWRAEPRRPRGTSSAGGAVCVKGNRPASERRGLIDSGMNHSSPPAPAWGGRPTPASRRRVIFAALRVIDIWEDSERTTLAFFVRPVRFGDLAWPGLLGWASDGDAPCSALHTLSPWHRSAELGAPCTGPEREGNSCWAASSDCDPVRPTWDTRLGQQAGSASPIASSLEGGIPGRADAALAVHRDQPERQRRRLAAAGDHRLQHHAR